MLKMLVLSLLLFNLIKVLINDLYLLKIRRVSDSISNVDTILHKKYCNILNNGKKNIILNIIDNLKLSL